MDGYEAMRIVFSRINSVDPANASKIMGLLLMQDHGEEMIRLAFGTESLLHLAILKARKDLGLPSDSPPTPSTPSSPSPFLSTNSIATSSQNSRLISSSSCGGASFSPPQGNISSPSTRATLSESLPNREELSDSNWPGGRNSGSSSSIYGNGSNESMIDEFQLLDQLSFLNDSSPPLGPNNPELFCPHSDVLSSPAGWGCSVHRRSCSVNDMCLGTDDPCSEIGWKPCFYYARGFCKNGSNCRFLHGGGLGDSASAPLMGGLDGGGSPMVGSPSKVDLIGQCHELLRSKSAQQQRLAAASQLMAGPSTAFRYSPKSLNLLHHQHNDPRSAAAALFMGDDTYKYGRSRLERNDFSTGGMASPASRQIYLTFPADSTFREGDVSNYFSIYGPVQDVRIPFQQKRMFGFVTFVYPESVKLVLAKGNPHFVCDSRVLVKPYKEKGKIPDKYRKQQVMDREFSPCGTPTGLDSRNGPFDLQLGTRSFYNPQDMLWRRKLEEQTDLQQALEFESQKLMSLQLLDVKMHHQHQSLYAGSPIPSPTRSSNLFNQTFVLPSMSSSPGFQEENGSSPASAIHVVSDSLPVHPIVTSSSGNDAIANDRNDTDKQSSHEDGDLLECLEQNLPDSPFASPIKASSEYISDFSNTVTKEDQKGATSESSSTSANSNMACPSLIPATSTVDMPSFKSFNCQIPRLSSGHGAMGIYTGASGPTYPIGV